MTMLQTDDYAQTDVVLPAWVEEEEAEEEDYQIEEYDLVSSPNDFNITTIFNFIESGAVRIPGFQRNYVWDIKRASKLIESIILGLPVPQIFLYEETRNKFLVIDGQQRLMSIYYFIKMRFPRRNKRSELRRLFAEHGRITDEILYDDTYFSKFDLVLPLPVAGKVNKFAGLNYSTLGEYRASFDLRTIRNVIVKQTYPRDDDSSIYEIFNRLNSGGMNLAPQEIRVSLYHSPFYDMLFRLNLLPGWRSILDVPDPELHMKDVEILLRSIAMLIDGHEYRSSMALFLDRFSKKAKTFSTEKISHLERLFVSFLVSSQSLPPHAFRSESGKFNISVFESVFAAVCDAPYHSGGIIEQQIDPDALRRLKADSAFIEASQRQTTNKSNVQTRLERARQILGSSSSG